MTALLLGIACNTGIFAQTILEAKGWNESLSITWTEQDSTIKNFNVYYTGNGIADRKIDNPLIRNYGDHFRADIPGLKAGNYTVKVCPVKDAVEQTGTQTLSLEVTARDRSGFAFTGTAPGSYQTDGTPKNNAVILYITQNTRNTVSMEVSGASVNPCVGLQAILDGFKKGIDNRPLIVRLVGQITDLDHMYNGDIVIENNNNTSGCITMEGIGNDATADGWGLRIKNGSNIEVSNIGWMNCNSDEGDNIGLQQNNDHIWIHNCDFFYGNAGSDADQIKGDGALDCKKSTYVTFSYNHFWDSGKSNLLGLSEGTTSGLYITYHHNWYDHSDSRHPRVRYYSAHVFNNYYDGNAKYGVGSTLGSSVFVEGNYFRNCKYPMLISMQGSDVFDSSKGTNDYTDMPTFSKEDGGIIKAWNNYISDAHRLVSYGATGFNHSTVDFDAYFASSRNEPVPLTVKSWQGANSYNNFDTNSSIMYAYTADDPATAREKVMKNAGRIGGGDFKWIFNNSTDDASYLVNTGLKAALTSYHGKLVKIQGENSISNGTGGGGTGGSGEIEGDIVHNFTSDGNGSSFFAISGNLSTSKGTVVYGSLTLTQCLKMESATLIEFTTTASCSMTLVFNDGFSGKVKIDGADLSAVNGILTRVLAPGKHSISKTDIANLYLISLRFPTGNLNPGNLSACKIFCNSTEGSLRIESAKELSEVSIFNEQGKLIFVKRNAGKSLITGGLKAGIYFARIKQDAKTITHKLIL